MTTADFYGRKSTSDDGRSVASQEDEWRTDCADQDLQPGRVFADPDRSASRYARRGRPDYDALLEHIRAGGCELLSMWESSRGSRDLAGWVALLDLCRGQGVLIRIVSHDRTYDVRRRRDWRSLADDGVDAADESEKISERTRRGKRAAAREGRPAGIPPYGFRRLFDDRGHFVEQVEHAEQAPHVREIIAKVAAGTALTVIAADLNARGVPSAAGVRWRPQSIQMMATNPAYAGLRVHQGTVVGEGTWAPLVDPSLWRAAQAVLTNPRRRTQRDTRLKHWLTGAVRCGICPAGRLRPGVRTGGLPVYKCAACHRITVRAGILEDTVEEALLARLDVPDLADVFATGVSSDAVKAALEQEKVLHDRLQGHYAEAAAGRLSPAGLSAVEAHLLPELQRAQQRARRLSMPSALAELDGVDIVGSWATMPPARRRFVVQAAADLVLTPGAPGRRPQPPMLERLSGSRWTGETLTWAERI